MKSADKPESDYVPLSRESVELFQEFWAQIGVSTTTAPPMDFLGLKQSALAWGDRLTLPAGILAKFRQRISSAQNDGEVFTLVKEFQQFAAAHGEPQTARAKTTGAGNAVTKRKGRRAMTMSMSTRAIVLVDEGMSNRLIAAQLGVSLASVKRNPGVQLARAELKARRAKMQQGHKSKSGDIEAYGDVNQDGERRPFRPR